MASTRSCWAPIILRSPEQRTARTGQVARPGSDAGQVRRNCRIRRQFRKKNPKNPDLGAGLAGLRCRAGAAGRLCQRQECGALGVGRARTHWASHRTRLGEPSNKVGRASTHWASPYSLGKPSTRLGEPVLIGQARIGRTRIGRAIKRGWGEPLNEVGRASTKGPLGEPLNFYSGLHACFKAAPAWRGA